MDATNAQAIGALRRAWPSPWWAFGALLILCWSLLLIMHGSAHVMHGSDSVGSIAAMWALMTVAMMAPTAVPVLASLRNVLSNGSMRPWWGFLAAYLVVWLGFAGMAAALQRGLIGLDLIGPTGSSSSRALSVVVLAGAGVYQLTSVKQRCLIQCVNPMTFFLRHWRDGTRGGVRMGTRHGVTCVGCCWALMLLALVGGMSNVVFMVGAAALMFIEKLPAVARRITVPIGVALLVASAYVLIFGIGAPAATPHHHHATAVANNEMEGSRSHG
ncbi:unannotated protein [freshwater metagenome]|uniref:Unannotated protein n=1 Tax=freshwater metagenome TaxID=449393 RepID=A0A6J7EJ78_9ZZZZ|nr:DUF2182 domain-containing protein [Actinomycetota bacterium]